MKANELRIGNLLLFNNMITKEEIVKVNAWFLRQLVHDPKVENPQLTGYYQPIPLTEEWLIMLGFEPTYFQKDGKLAYYRINGKDFISSKMELILFNTKIEFIHQLQNLYFALTGEELTLNQ